MQNEYPCEFSEEVYSWTGNDGGHQIGRMIYSCHGGRVWSTEGCLLMKTWPDGQLIEVPEPALSLYLGDANNPRRKQVERDLTATEKADINTLVENALGPTIDAAMGGN